MITINNRFKINTKLLKNKEKFSKQKFIISRKVKNIIDQYLLNVGFIRENRCVFLRFSAENADWKDTILTHFRKNITICRKNTTTLTRRKP